MTSQSHTAAVGARRRPTPPRPAAPQYAGSGPVTYVPEEYAAEPTAAPVTSLPGQFGTVLPTQRTGKAVWITLTLIVASVVAFVGWRVQHGGGSSSSGVTYTSTAGHFAAHFPSQPTEAVRTIRRGALRATFHDVAVQGEAVVTEGDLRGPLPAHPAQVRDILVRQITTGDLALTSLRTVEVHGVPARQGNLVEPTGDVLAVLVIAPSPRRYYLLAAPLGAPFQALKDSFRILS